MSSCPSWRSATGFSSGVGGDACVGGIRWRGWHIRALYVVLALVVLNQAGRRAPYYFLDPGSVGVATVVLNICVLGGAVIAVGYALLAVNRLATPPRIDAV